jgi:apolipoprotein N-acyltransferase
VKPPARATAEAWALAGAHVALWIASFPPHGWWALALVSWAPLCMLALRDGRRWAPVLAVAATSFAGWMWMQRFLVDVSALGYPALAVYMAAWSCLGFAVIRALAVQRPAARLPLAVTAPCAVVSIEWLRGVVVFDGYPWYHAGHPLVDAELVSQVADISGASLASAIAVSCAGALADIVCMRTRGRRRASAGAALAMVLLASASGYGLWRSAEAAGARRTGPAVMAVQTNVPIDNKLGWTRDRQESDVARFITTTLELAEQARVRGERIDLIAWPETMLPGLGMEPDAVRLLVDGQWWPGDRFSRVPQLLSERLGVPLLVGSPAYIGLRAESGRWAWDRHHNSAYLVDAKGPPYVRVDKLFLTPFGETMPYISAWDWLEQVLLDLGARGMTFDLDPGDAPVRIDVPVAGGSVARVAVPICFEITVPRVVRRLVWVDGVRAADALVNITNDGWFGGYDAGRAHHGLIARWRAIENRVPIVRVANTGVSEAFDSLGRPVPGASCPPRVDGGFVVDLPLDSRTPPYAAVGDIASVLMTIATALMLLASRVHGRDAASGRGGTAVGTSVPAAALALAAVVMAGVGCSGASRQDPAPHTQIWGSRQLSTADKGSAGMPTPSGSRIVPPNGAEGRELALSVLLQAARSPDPSQRANSLEALSGERAALMDVLRESLGDPNRGVRFTACMCAGRAKAVSLANIIEPLALDESGSVRAAALFALVRMGRRVDITPLAALAMSDDPEVRANAVLVLGELGDRSAVPLIEAVAGRPLKSGDQTRARIVDLQCAEALAKLGQRQALDPIRAALFAPSEQAELIALACQIVGEIRDEGSRGALMRLWNADGSSMRPPEIRLAAATALARLGEPDMRPVLVMTRLAANSPDPFIRAQAATALGWIPTAEAQALLAPMLRDRNPYVQISAAGAWLRSDAARGRAPEPRRPLPGLDTAPAPTTGSMPVAGG